MKWKNIILTAALFLLPANRTSKKQYISDEIAQTLQLQEIATNDPYITVKISDLEGTPLFGSKKMITPNYGNLLGFSQAENIISSTQKGRKIKANEIVKTNETIKIPLIYPELRNYLPNTWDELKEGAFKKYKEINDKDLVIVTKCKNGKHALAYYENGKLALATYVSIGTNDNPTIKGKYQGKKASIRRRSSKYNHEPMPYAIAIESGYFLHQGRSDGFPRSHGCVRLPGWYIKWLYEHLKEGTIIIIEY